MKIIYNPSTHSPFLPPPLFLARVKRVNIGRFKSLLSIEVSNFLSRPYKRLIKSYVGEQGFLSFGQEHGCKIHPKSSCFGSAQ